MENTRIEWADHTFNPWIGCTKVSAGCDRCYAEHKMDRRFHKVESGNHPRQRTSAANWRKPLTWQRDAAATGHWARVFCASLADTFDNQVPEDWRRDLWDLMARCPDLHWMLLTKRPQNIAKMLPADWPRPNVWLGITAENQAEFDRRWPILAELEAVIRFVSYEPALGPIRLGAARPDWVICGGESVETRPLAREMDPEWARSMRAQCAQAGVAFFMKQMTQKRPIPDDLIVRRWPRADRHRRSN